MPDVRSFNHNDPGIAAHLMMELPVSDVESNHCPGAALQKAISEPTSRSTDVDRRTAFNPDTKRLDRAVEFRPGAADELCWWTVD